MYTGAHIVHNLLIYINDVHSSWSVCSQPPNYTHTHNVIHIIYQINKHTFTNKIPKLTTYLWWADKLRGPASNTKHGDLGYSNVCLPTWRGEEEHFQDTFLTR